MSGGTTSATLALLCDVSIMLLRTAPFGFFVRRRILYRGLSPVGKE